MDLRPHLRGDTGLGRGLADDPRFRDVVAQRLLAVDVLLELQRRQRREGVRVLGGADDDGVELAGVVVELPEVHFLPRLRMLGRHLVERHAIHVADGHDLLPRDALEIVGAASAAADDGDAQLVVTELSAQDGRRRRPEGRRGGAWSCEEKCGVRDE